jgi:transcriptional regulator with GAF, ATPase, and Fis domain
MTVVSTERLADVFVELADTLVDDFDVIEFLMMVAHRTSELIGDADVGILLADQRGHLQFMAGSNEDVKRLELFQLQVHEGPCMDAVRDGQPVVNADLQMAEDRWPRFAPRAVAAGYQSVHAFPLRLRDEVIGAIGVFGTDNARWEDADVHIAQTLAHVATIGLLQERAVRRGAVLTEQLQAALNSRIVIEQAKGAIAQFHSVTVDEAFVLLRSHARRTGAHLGVVAHAVLTDPATLAGLSGAPASDTDRRERIGDILHRGDERDSAAERRDRAADERPSEDVEAHSGLDRIWAGRDRDASMIDRADLIKEMGDPDTPEADDKHQ